MSRFKRPSSLPEAAKSGVEVQVQVKPTSPAPELKLPQEVILKEAQDALLNHGDYGKLTQDQRNALLLNLCQNHGLDPSTRPFGFITADGKKLLYAFKSASDGIAKVRRLTDKSLDIIPIEGGGFIYKAGVCDQDFLESEGRRGRIRYGVGVVPPGLLGSAAANAHKKAETQAHRRAILSLEAPGFVDESEASDIPGSRVDSDEARFENARPAAKASEPKPNLKLPSKTRSRVRDQGR